MKRREFLVAAGLTGVMPRLLRASTPPADAQADWKNRISGPGVIWYNGFQSAAEVDIFRWANNIGNDPRKTAPNAALAQWNASGGPGGSPHLSITRNAGSGETTTAWWRPFSPMTAASNGKGVDDPAAGGSIPLQTWDPTNVNELAGWPRGWYSQNSAIADGTDFYVQLRVKMDPNASGPGMNQGCKLLELGIAERTFTAQNIVTVLNGSFGGKNHHRMYIDGTVYNYFQGGGPGTTSLEQDSPLAAQSALGPYICQVGGQRSNFVAGGAYCSRITTGNAGPQYCWAYSGGWDTLLYHLTPGPANVGTAETSPTMCTIQVWGANPGETTYTKIWDMPFKLLGWQGENKQGWQALYLATYSNNENQPLAFTSRYAQIVFSKRFIPCPLV